MKRVNVKQWLTIEHAFKKRRQIQGWTFLQTNNIWVRSYTASAGAPILVDKNLCCWSLVPSSSSHKIKGRSQMLLQSPMSVVLPSFFFLFKRNYLAACHNTGTSAWNRNQRSQNQAQKQKSRRHLFFCFREQFSANSVISVDFFSHDFHRQRATSAFWANFWA